MENAGRRKIFFTAGKIFILPILLFVLSGCSNPLADFGLKKVDSGLGDFFDKIQEDQAEDSLNKKEKKDPYAANNLTDSQKKAIDVWLEENGYNRYGDAQNAIYLGGTPLFNEATGEAIDRYDYILKKFPDILNKISGD